MVAVGIPVARDPPLGSVQAQLAHTALVSDSLSEPLLRIRVENAGLGKPGFNDWRHALPSEVRPLASTLQGPVPKPRYLLPECL